MSSGKLRVALTIAGSDPSGGAGLQADLKTFHQFGVYGEAVVTLITVQNTRSVDAVRLLDPDLVGAQLDAVLLDIPPQAVKTGALGDARLIECVAYRTLPNLVVDPVMISKHGAPLMAPEARQMLLKVLLPKARVVTPNAHEAEALTGTSDAWEAARRLADMGARAVVIKGGHRSDAEDYLSTDLLLEDGIFHEFSAPRMATAHTHGTGCTFAAAITALLAQGVELPEAVAEAKQWITEAIRTNPGLGGGSGPVNHFATRPGR